MIAALLLLAAGAADTAPTDTRSLQQRFDDASRLVEQTECKKAIAELEALKAEPAFRPTGLGGAMLLSRQGLCMVRIGMFDLGEKQIKQGLPVLRKQSDSFPIDIANSLIALGDVAMSRWDYALATDYYREAGALPDAVSPVTLHGRLARSMAFDGGPEPLHHAEQALKLAKANPAIPKDQLVGAHMTLARILLNQGQNRDAYDELRVALKLTGGLDYEVNLTDVSLRSDLAVAAQLSGDQQGAREYLVYTGAGRFQDGALTSSQIMEPPVCGAETGLRPEDFAIVAFSIGPEGRVNRAETVYTPGNAHVASQFAQAVGGWAWAPEALAGIPPFFLQSTYVELRCTTQAQAVPGPTTPFNERFASWASEVAGLGDINRAAIDQHVLVDRLRVLEAQDAGASPRAKRVAISGLLMLYELGGADRRSELVQRAVTAASGLNLPSDVEHWLQFQQAQRPTAESVGPETAMSALLALLDNPGFAADPLAASTVRILAAREPRDRFRTRGRPEFYQMVAQDDRLPPHHPLRQLANLSLANLAAKERDFETASGYFEKTGLTEEQCALIGARPSARRIALSSNDYPSEALMSGFEGFVRLEFDIQSDGKTADVRPIVAYPPFVFNDAASSGIRRSLYEPSFRPSGGTACAANRQGVQFGMAGRR